MKTTLFIFLLSVCYLLGNAQESNFFEIKTSQVEPVMISLIPISRINPKPNDKVGEIKMIDQGIEIGKKISDIAAQSLTPANIPDNTKKISYYDIYFDKNKNIMKIIFTLHKDILKYTTEQQWINCYNQIKAINLEPYVEIINKDNFDFSVISGSLFQ